MAFTSMSFRGLRRRNCAQPAARLPVASFLAETHTTIASVSELAWDSLAPSATECYALYRALELVPPPGFTLGAMTVADGHQLIASVPLFRMRFRLDTPFQGALRQVSNRLHRLTPRLTSLRILGFGSPMSDNCSIGLDPGLCIAERASARATLIAKLMELARQEHDDVLVIKGLGADASEWHDDLSQLGYGRIRSVPVVVLPLQYSSLEHYLASLPEKTGSYLRRKMRSATKVRIEYRSSIAGLEREIMALHDATLAQSMVDYGEFDKLHPDYFLNLLEGLGERAKLMLCWRGEELLSFQVFIVGERRIIANKIGMKYPMAREHNLYFVNWLKMIEFAIERGIPEIEMGATTYAAKLLFGGRLDARWIYFRLRNGLLNNVTRPLHGLFDFERNDPELRKLAAAGRLPRA